MVCVGSVRVRVGSARLTNLFILAMQNTRVGGLYQLEPPVRPIAFWWNIGFSVYTFSLQVAWSGLSLIDGFVGPRDVMLVI